MVVLMVYTLRRSHLLLTLASLVAGLAAASSRAPLAAQGNVIEIAA